MKNFKTLEEIYENINNCGQQHNDAEGGMILNQIETIITSANKLKSLITDPNAQLPAWIQSKITLAEDYLITASNYVESGTKTGDPEIAPQSQPQTVLLKVKDV